MTPRNKDFRCSSKPSLMIKSSLPTLNRIKKMPMNNLNRTVITCAVIFTTLVAAPLGFASSVPTIEFIESVEEFQFQERGEETDRQIRKILDLADKTAVVQVDWRLRFFSGAQDLNGCENGRVTDYERPYRLPVDLVSTHFVMSVIPGSPLRFPFNSVSCMMTGGDDFAIQITGFYVISQVDIPTANNVEMRPVSPFEKMSITEK